MHATKQDDHWADRETADAGEDLASRSEEELEQLAAAFIRERAMQESPLLGQYHDMFSEWETMMEAYRQEELEEQEELARDPG